MALAVVRSHGGLPGAINEFKSTIWLLFQIKGRLLLFVLSVDAIPTTTPASLIPNALVEGRPVNVPRLVGVVPFQITDCQYPKPDPL